MSDQVYHNLYTGYWYIRDLSIKFVSDNEAYEYLEELER